MNFRRSGLSAFSLSLKTRGRVLCAAVLLTILGAGTAAAQPSEDLGFITCSAISAPVAVDATGAQEQVGDIVVTCQNHLPAIVPAANSLLVNISVSLSLNITNDTRTGVPGTMTDARLVMNGNDCPTPSDTADVFGSCGAPSSILQDPQFGVLATANRVEWNSVRLPVPGASVTGVPVADCSASPDACFPDPISFRITGIEADASQLGVSSGTAGQITAFLSLTAPTAISVTNNVLNVAYVTIGGVEPPSDPSLVTGVTCSASATPYPVDPAGFDEPLGEVVLFCSNSEPIPPGSNVTLGLALLLNTDITFGEPPQAPVLVINGNDCSSPAADGSTFGSCGAPDPTVQDPQFGEVDEARRVDWRDVTLPVPPAGDGLTTLRIKGLRGDVANLLAGASFPSTQVSGALLMQLPVTNNLFNVGIPSGAPSPSTTEGNPGDNTCQVTAAPPTIRAEGITEILADIVFICENSGADVTATESVMDFLVALNVNVTNNVGFGPGADLTDAVLIVNENNCTSPAAAGGAFDTCGAANPAVQDPQFGALEGPNMLAWRGVHVPIGAATTVRISGMRGRASELGIPATPIFPSTQVTAFLAISEQSFSVTNNVHNVGTPILGSTASWTAQSAEQCEAGSVNLPITLTEGFATSFRMIGEPSFTPGNAAAESGYFAPGSNNGGGASQATRIALLLSGVPDGVSLTVPKRIEVPGDPPFILQWVSGADATGAGGSVSSETDDLVIDSPSGGAASVFYEVVQSDPFTIESVVIPVTAAWAAGAPAPGTIQARAHLAPLSAVIQASFPAAEPRFELADAPASALLTIEGCGGEPEPEPEPADPVADVRVAIDSSPNVARPQKNLRFGVRVVNAGDATAESVLAVVQLPPAFHLGVTPSLCAVEGQQAVCDLGDLAPSANVMLNFVGGVDMAATRELAIFANVATASADANPGNDAASLIVPLHTQADVAASAYILPKGGLDAILTVSASNRGPARAESVKLRAELPAGFDLLETPAGCTLSGANLACEIPGLNPGRTKAYLLPVRRLTDAAGPFVATVFASSSTSDPSSANNTYTLEFESFDVK